MIADEVFALREEHDLPASTYVSKTISVGGRVERTVADLLDRSFLAFSTAAQSLGDEARTPGEWYRGLCRGLGLLEAVEVVAGVSAVQVDRLFTSRFGALPAEVYGSPL